MRAAAGGEAAAAPRTSSRSARVGWRECARVSLSCISRFLLVLQYCCYTAAVLQLLPKPAYSDGFRRRGLRLCTCLASSCNLRSTLVRRAQILWRLRLWHGR